MKTEDKLTPELRKIEKEIDNYYKSNPLVQLPFATAAWYLLASVEHWVLIQRCNTHILDLQALGLDIGLGQTQPPYS